MLYFYLILGIVSFLFLIIDIISYYTFKVKLFGDGWELFKNKSNTIDLQIIFPKNLRLILLFIFSFSLCGLILNINGIIGWISAPCGFVFAVFVNIVFTKLIPDLFERIKGKKLPVGELLNGFSATVTEKISADDYGKIIVQNNKKEYEFNALSANETTLEKGSRVVIIYEIDGFCYVEGENEIFDILEEPINPQQEPSQPDPSSQTEQNQ